MYKRQDMTEELVNDLRAELQRGIINGEGIDTITKRIEKVFDTHENRAEMIARTETNRAENQGKFQAFKQLGKGYKKWVTHFDNRTSELCKRLNGQIVPLNENFKDPKGEWEGLVPPAHVNCRSTWVYIPQEEYKEKD